MPLISGDVEEESRDIAAWAAEAGHPSLGNRIRFEVHSTIGMILVALVMTSSAGGWRQAGRRRPTATSSEARACAVFDRVLPLDPGVDEQGLPDRRNPASARPSREGSVEGAGLRLKISDPREPFPLKLRVERCRCSRTATREAED